jgi:hypothetical protein
VVFAILPFVTPQFFRKYGGRVSELEAKYILFLLTLRLVFLTIDPSCCQWLTPGTSWRRSCPFSIKWPQAKNDRRRWPLRGASSKSDSNALLAGVPPAAGLNLAWSQEREDHREALCSLG